MIKNSKVAIVATVPFFLDNQLRLQMESLLKQGFNLSAVTSSKGDWSRLEKVEDLQCIKLDIARDPAPIKDIVSLFKLYRLFKNQKFDLVHSTTPKAGLLCALASWSAKTPVRLHTFTGQTWATKKGISKWVLRFFDKCIVLLNSQCYADSESQRQYLIKEGVGDEISIKVLGQGSLAGVDLNRFNRQLWLNEQKNTRLKLGVASDSFVLIFIGRLSREKGIFELIEAFEALKKKHDKLDLILVGPSEELAVEDKIESWRLIPGLHYVGETDIPEKYLSISDLLCLPSYREGFGTVVIEAAAMEVPTLGTKITGLNDAVEDAVTGVLVEPKSVLALQVAIDSLLTNRDRCKSLGLQAFKRCKREFDEAKMSRLVAYEYEVLLSKLNF